MTFQLHAMIYGLHSPPWLGPCCDSISGNRNSSLLGDCLLGSVCSWPYWIRSTTSGSRSSPCLDSILRIAGRMYLEERQKVRLGSWSTFWLWKDLDSGSVLGEKGLGFGAQVERWAFDRMIESRACIDLFLCKLRLNVVCWKWTEEGWWKIMKI